jgi:hypothetical protein
MTKRTKLPAKWPDRIFEAWRQQRTDWIAHERETQRIERHAARAPWSWSVPYQARPKVKR